MSNIPLGIIKNLFTSSSFFAVVLNQITYSGKKIHDLIEAARLQIMLVFVCGFLLVFFFPFKVFLKDPAVFVTKGDSK